MIILYHFKHHTVSTMQLSMKFIKSRQLKSQAEECTISLQALQTHYVGTW